MSVLIFTENWEGQFKKMTYELVSYASAVAEMMNIPLVAVSIGNVEESELNKLATYGADKIVTVADNRIKGLDAKAYTSIIAQVAEKEATKLLVFTNNNAGRALAPRLSARLKAGLTSVVLALPESVEPFIIRKKVYSGKASARVKINSEIKVLTLSVNSHEISENPKPVNTETFAAYLQDGDFNINILETNKVTGKLLLTDAELVVSGGRGLKGPENWNLVLDLAEALGAGTACSRPVADEGWRPHEEHTGQTGKVIAPNLYIAAGISGAIQHLAGISGTKCLVAVNKDPEAPIFEAADYGIVGDVMEVLPKLTEAVNKLKNS